ncbi:MAG TPA: MoxR family ATPase [Pyrinomonadaceae bacterium]
MSFPYYLEQREKPEDKVPDDLSIKRQADMDDATGYRPGKGLTNAVNVALLLGQPLLLTGEPGTGKTQLAHSLSWQLGFKKPSPLIFETKSTSTARDLFYSYDTIGRFHAAQLAKLKDEQGQPFKDKPEDFIVYNALGAAILLAAPYEEARKFLPERNSENGDFANDFLASADKAWQRRSVVLIDEIDKAPRDFPNDILNEIENMYFRVAELGNQKIKADEQFRPVVILTSNSEKNLPDAFLRRCVYYNIAFPEIDEMKNIVAKRLESKNHYEETGFGNQGKWIDDALELFYEIRDAELLLVKKPATAELLGWLTAIRRLCAHYIIRAQDLKSKQGVEKVILPTLGVLIKNEGDMTPATEIVNRWAE